MKIELLTSADLIWPLGSQDSLPEYRCGLGTYPRALKVDPFPCYSHEMDRVGIIAKLCEDAFPLPDTRVGIYVLSHDFIDRVNGLTFEESIYNRDDGYEWDDKIKCQCGCGETHSFFGQAITIALAGKRIPLMPSMTRYLVSHEYGHAVFDYVVRKMGYKDQDRPKLHETYMKLRGVEDYSKIYTGGRWHDSPEEIIANDFRILFTKQEMEFFPHSVSLPAWSEKEGKWWKTAAEICGVKLK